MIYVGNLPADIRESEVEVVFYKIYLIWKNGYLINQIDFWTLQEMVDYLASNVASYFFTTLVCHTNIHTILMKITLKPNQIYGNIWSLFLKLRDPLIHNLHQGSFSVFSKEICPWIDMMEVPQLHRFGPAANRFLEAYKMLLKFENFLDVEDAIRGRDGSYFAEVYRDGEG
ncbi:uncharacterized protein [Primulina huaijiensis]|uniref:uncharacterized protein n=1 Tax=Primulina huaijiensis TaxID=1492673 RepID=UPI003CC6F217